MDLRRRISGGFEIVLGRWPVWIAALTFGGLCSVLGYSAFKSASTSYPDFVIGIATLTGASKAGEYAMLLAFMIGAAAAFTALALLFRRVQEIGETPAVEEVIGRFIIAALPVLTWFATFLLPQGANLGLFWLSVFLAGTMALGLWLMLMRADVWFARGRSLAMLDCAVLLPAAAMMAALAVATFGNRFAFLFTTVWFKHRDTVAWMSALAALVAVIAVFLLAHRARDAIRTTAHIRALLIALQTLFPALFLVILPAVMDVPGGGLAFAGPMPPTTATWIFLGVLTLATWADLVRLYRKGMHENAAPAAAVSVFSLIAVIMYCRMPMAAVLGTPMDDYDAGENLIPWWAWTQHHMLPLWDWTPPRGLINYKAGLLAWLFTEETAAGLIATAPYHFTFILLLVFIPVAMAIGKWRAFVVLAFAALDDRLGDIDALMTAGLCILVFAWNKYTHVKWLLIWLLTGTAAVLIAPGQGGLLVVATMPGGLWRLWRAYRDDRLNLLKTGGITLAILALVCVATPLGLMILGAVRYGLGQSAVNAIANGLAWELAVGSVPNVNPWLYEILKFSWIGGGAIALVMTIWVWVNPTRTNRGQELFIATAVSILCALFIVRSAVRIDAQFVSRPGWASIWVLAFLLPVLLSVLLRGNRQLTALTMIITAAATLTAQFGTVGIDNLFARPFMFQAPVAEEKVTNGAALGMPNMGRVSMDKDSVKRLTTVKARLDQWLAPDETYIDMSNHGAHYFYFGRRPPGDLSAFYNMITGAQQRRAVSEIVRQNVGVAVTGADNILLDTLPASLRSYAVYRHLVLNFVPVNVDGYDYMLRPERLARAGLTPPSTEEAANILERDFTMYDLKRAPVAFGKSADTLSKRMRTVMAVDETQILDRHDAEKTDGKAYRITGPQPRLSLALPKVIRGRDAGLLQFSLTCENKRARPALVVGWGSPDQPALPRAALTFELWQGTIILPVDTSPRWLTAPEINNLTFTMTNPTDCGAFALTDIILAQRAEADEVDALTNAESPR